MRLLFLSGVDVGGAPKSTLELASQLGERGHVVRVVLGSAAPGSVLYDYMVRATVKLRDRRLGPTVQGMARRLGAGTLPGVSTSANIEVLHTKHAENALPEMLDEFGPDAVIMNSFPREQTRWIVEDLAAVTTPAVLYMREAHALTHLSISGLRFDLIFGNSRQWCEAAARAGHQAVFAPSIVDLTQSTAASTRATATMVNPIAENRPEVLRALAVARPDIHCVLQESWPLAAADRARLDRWSSALPNLEFRDRVAVPSDVYRDMRVLVATYPTSRPRVVLESQANGIPVVATDQPSLAEAVGPGGVLIPENAPDSVWIEQISLLWDDASAYSRMSDRARAFARRDEVRSEFIVATIEQSIEAIL